MTPTSPPPSTAALLDCIQTQDFSRQEGKKALWRALTPFGPAIQQDFERYRDEYLEQSFPAGDANRMAANDVAAELEAKEESEEAFGGGGSDPSVERSHHNRFDVLMAEVRELTRGARSSIRLRVLWVADNIGTRMDLLEVNDIPGPGALRMWLWAGQNETEFRRTFEAKLIPSKGIAEDEEPGFVDDGKAILDIMSRIRDGVKVEDSRLKVENCNLQPSNL